MNEKLLTEATKVDEDSRDSKQNEATVE